MKIVSSKILLTQTFCLFLSHIPITKIYSLPSRYAAIVLSKSGLFQEAQLGYF